MAHFGWRKAVGIAVKSGNGGAPLESLVQQEQNDTERAGEKIRRSIARICPGTAGK